MYLYIFHYVKTSHPNYFSGCVKMKLGYIKLS